MKYLVLMLGKIRKPIGIISLSLVLFVSWSAQVYGTEIVNVCNEGDVEVFYVSLGVHESFMSNGAVIQGMFSIDPGHCRNVVPGGMSDVTVAFFYRDRAGTFGNGVFMLKGKKKSLFKPKYSQICVHPEDFRKDTRGEHSGLNQFIKTWTPPCLHGYFPAKTSFGIYGESNYIYTIHFASSQKTLVTPFPPLPENERKTFDDGARPDAHLRDDVPHGKGTRTGQGRQAN